MYFRSLIFFYSDGFTLLNSFFLLFINTRKANEPYFKGHVNGEIFFLDECVTQTDDCSMGEEEPNHTTARKPGPL